MIYLLLIVHKNNNLPHRHTKIHIHFTNTLFSEVIIKLTMKAYQEVNPGAGEIPGHVYNGGSPFVRKFSLRCQIEKRTGYKLTFTDVTLLQCDLLTEV